MWNRRRVFRYQKWKRRGVSNSEKPKPDWEGISMAGWPLDNDGNYSFSHTVAQSVIP